MEKVGKKEIKLRKRKFVGGKYGVERVEKVGKKEIKLRKRGLWEENNRSKGGESIEK